MSKRVKVKKINTDVEQITISFAEMYKNTSKAIYDIVSKRGMTVTKDELAAMMLPFQSPAALAASFATGGVSFCLGEMMDQVFAYQEYNVPFVIVVTHVDEGQEFIYAMVTSMNVAI